MKNMYTKRIAFGRVTKKFGELVTCDHMVMSKIRLMGRSGEASAFVMKGVRSGFLWGHPVLTKSADEVLDNIRHFMGTRNLVKLY